MTQDEKILLRLLPLASAFLRAMLLQTFIREKGPLSEEAAKLARAALVGVRND